MAEPHRVLRGLRPLRGWRTISAARSRPSVERSPSSRLNAERSHVPDIQLSRLRDTRGRPGSVALPRAQPSGSEHRVRAADAAALRPTDTGNTEPLLGPGETPHASGGLVVVAAPPAEASIVSKSGVVM